MRLNPRPGEALRSRSHATKGKEEKRRIKFLEEKIARLATELQICKLKRRDSIRHKIRVASLELRELRILYAQRAGLGETTVQP